MKTLALLAAFILIGAPARTEDVFKIQIGKDWQKYSNSDLQKRVWELERAVWQLQQKVFELETAKNLPKANTWVCTINAMGNTYSATGPTKAVATLEAVQKCKDSRGGDGFFCKDVKCEQ